jgi:UDP-glucose 4-epimerase
MRGQQDLSEGHLAALDHAKSAKTGGYMMFNLGKSVTAWSSTRPLRKA